MQKKIGELTKDNSRKRQKSIIENRIKKAKEQADNIILDIDDSFSEIYIDETICN